MKFITISWVVGHIWFEWCIIFAFFLGGGEGWVILVLSVIPQTKQMIHTRYVILISLIFLHN